MSVAAAAAEEADIVPQQCIKINKDLLDALVKNLLKSASPGTHAAHIQTLVEQRLAKILPSIKTPDHPPYALMIRQAIMELDEEGGSNEEAISELIKRKFKDLPWGHVNFLRHHLKKLKDEEEIFQVSGNRYKLLPEGDDSIGKVKKSKKRKRRSGKEECYSQCKVSKSGGSSKEKNSVDKEDQEKSGVAALHFKESEVQKNQNEEQQKQEVICGSRKESRLGLEVNEKVNQVHLDSEECERTKDATREETLHHMKDAYGLEQQKQDVTCSPRQEVNKEVSQVHIVEDASREPNGAEEQNQLIEQQNQSREQQQQEVPCVPSQLGSEIGEEADVNPQKECEGMEDVTPTAEASSHLQGQEKEFGEDQSREVSCTARKQTALGFEVNGEANQLCEQDCEKTDDVSRKEVENSVAIEEENSAKELSTSIIEDLQQGHRSEEVTRHVNQIEEQNSLQMDGQKEERVQSRAIAEQELKSQQFAVIEELQQKERIDEVIDTLIQVDEEPSEREKENGLSIEGENEEREQTESIEEQKEANCTLDATIENLQNQMEVDPIQVEEDLDQMEEDNSVETEGEKEETTRNNETEDQQETICEKQDAPTEKQGATGVSEEQFDGKVVVLVEEGKVPAVELQEQPMEIQGLSGVLEGQIVSKGAENLTEEQCDGSLQVAVIEKQVKSAGLQKQQQWEPEVNEQHLQLKEIGAEIVECIEKIITPQRLSRVVVGNKREGEACGRAENLISSSLRQEQCLELLSRTAKMQGIAVELLKSFGKAESSRRPSDLSMLESNESELSDEQLPNATQETSLPPCRDLVVVEPRENVEISCSTRLEVSETELPLKLDLPVVESLPQENVEQSTTSEAEQQEAVLKDSEEHQEVAMMVEPKEPVEQLCNSSTNTTTITPLQLEETMVENHQERQPELHSVQPQVEPLSEVPEVGSTLVGEEATKTSLLLNLNSTLDVPGFLPGQEEALNNKEPSAESNLENTFHLKLPDLQPETISSIYLEGKEIPGHTVSADSTLLSLSLASQEQQQKPTDFVDGNQQLYQQKKELPTPVLQQNAEPTFWQQHVQSESQSVNLQKKELPTPVLKQNAEPTFWQHHVQSESQSVNNLQNEELATPVLQQNAEPSFWQQHMQSESQSVNLQKEELPTPVLPQNAEPTFWQQHLQSESQSVNLQKEQLPTPVLQQNAEPTFWQQHVQSESLSVNNLQNEELATPVLPQNAEPSFFQQHVQSESQSVKITVNNEMLQPNLFQGGPKAPPPFGGDSNTGIFGTPQKQQQNSMLLFHGQQTQVPSTFDAGSLFGNSMFQQPLPISPMKPSSLSGGKLQPLKPIELKKLMEESLKPKQTGSLQQVINVDEIELREVPSSSVGGFKRKLQFQASPVKSPSLIGEVVGESEQVTPKKRRGRPPKQQTPGHTPSPQSRRPKIRQTVPKKKPSTAANGEEGVSSKSPAKKSSCRPPKRVKVAPIVEEPVIIPKNPF